MPEVGLTGLASADLRNFAKGSAVSDLRFNLNPKGMTDSVLPEPPLLIILNSTPIRPARGGRITHYPIGFELDHQCVASDCAQGCVGLGRGIWTAPGRGTDEMFCLRSRSTACSVAVSWAICSRLAARSFRSAANQAPPYRARSSAMGLSCCPNSREVSVETDVTVAETGNNQPSDGT
jgi:hypothetical protein